MEKGVLRMAVSLVSVFIAIAATVILSPVIADALKKNTLYIVILRIKYTI